MSAPDFPPTAHVDKVMSRAETSPRSDGWWYAYIKGASHRAYAYGPNHIEALAALRKEVCANWVAVLQSLAVIEGKEAV